MTTKRTRTPSPGLAGLRRDLHRAELELALEEARYTKQMLAALTGQEQRALAEQTPVKEDEDAAKWVMIASGGTLTWEKDVAELRDRAVSRRQAYLAWRLDPHGHGILRTFQKFVIGKGVTFTSAESRRGRWDAARRAVVVTDDPEDLLITTLVWREFEEREGWNQKDKELVRRTFRDGEALVRRFERSHGRCAVRFVEPEQVASSETSGTVMLDDGTGGETVRPTVIREGVEVLADDVETPVAFRVKIAGTETRVPAEEMLHVKAFADANDPRGVPLLEPALKKLKQYELWLDYRIVLNKVRTAIALVRKVEGAQAQATSLLAGRAGVRTHPEGKEPQTTSGKREAMFSPGTVLTAGPGVSYEWSSANIQARDAAEDGRNILLAVAVAVGLPEMFVTGSWENAILASTKEAGTPAVREWEDWQDFFEPAFRTVWTWVMQAAIAGQVLPADTDLHVELAWPPLVFRDAPKETDRNAVLSAAGLLSGRTWAGREGLDWEAEQQSLGQEAERTAEEARWGVGEEQILAAHAALQALAELDEVAWRHASVEVRQAIATYTDRARRAMTLAIPEGRPQPSPTGQEASTARAVAALAADVQRLAEAIERRPSAEASAALTDEVARLRGLLVEEAASDRERAAALGAHLDRLETQLAAALAAPPPRTPKRKRVLRDPETHLITEIEEES